MELPPGVIILPRRIAADRDSPREAEEES